MPPTGSAVPFDIAVLAQDERHLRRKVITLAHGDRVLVDFAEPLVLEDRDVLVLEDGRHVEIIAADEELLEVRGRDAVHLAGLAWHIGNRHLAAAIEAERILILRDHVIKAMLEGLGAAVTRRRRAVQPACAAPIPAKAAAMVTARTATTTDITTWRTTHGHDHSHAHGPHARGVCKASP